jgi:predicted AlkP superfamily pyrophosphatase or phosphodiesterase
MNKIGEMDQLFGYLIKKLEVNKLLNKTNIVVVSDHGMAQVKHPGIKLTDYINMTDIYADRIAYRITIQLFAKEGKKLKVFDSLKSMPNVTVYLREQIPERYHFKTDKKIGNKSN